MCWSQMVLPEIIILQLAYNVWGNIDYYNKADELILNMEQLEQQFGIVRDSADFWLESYKNWLNDSGTTLTANGEFSHKFAEH